MIGKIFFKYILRYFNCWIFSNDFYGGMWASFNLEGMEKYVIKPQVSSNKNVETNTELLKNGEHFLQIGNTLFGVSNVTHKWHIAE